MQACAAHTLIPPFQSFRCRRNVRIVLLDSVDAVEAFEFGGVRHAEERTGRQDGPDTPDFHNDFCFHRISGFVSGSFFFDYPADLDVVRRENKQGCCADPTTAVSKKQNQESKCGIKKRDQRHKREMNERREEKRKERPRSQVEGFSSLACSPCCNE